MLLYIQVSFSSVCVAGKREFASIILLVFM